MYIEKKIERKERERETEGDMTVGHRELLTYSESSHELTP
jgi:hypothetical protein